MQVQMLGTGTVFTKKYYNNNALVYVNGYKLMIDCGVTAPRSLSELQIPLHAIDGILISHIHSDHVGGLEEVAFHLMYSARTKIKLFVPSSIADPLWERSLRGGLENPADGINRLEDYFDVVTIEDNTKTDLFEGLSIEAIRTKHIPQKPSYSFVLNDYVFYSADTVFDFSLLKEMHENRKCKYILHECQFNSPGLVHATLDELLTLPDEIQEKVFLMHYNDNKDQYVGKTGRMRFLEQHQLYEFPL
nr:MBL fold metallo-hydrolase [Paenibacillus hamazuiensis]